MELIADRYSEIKDKTVFEDSKDELIVECYQVLKKLKSILISLGSLLIALLTFLKRKDK